MANDVAPMMELFQACSEVLDQAKVPMHYRELTLASLQRIDYDKAKVNWSRQIEDVREKMLLAGRFNTFYTGRPLGCLAAKRDWFETGRFFATVNQEQIIPIDPSIVESVAYEALMRVPHMLQRNLYASQERRNAALARGFTIEFPVRQHFREQWPEFYKPPANEGIWERWCDHDFRLEVGPYNWKIDVSGPDQNGQYSNPGKRTADLHLLCRKDDGHILWEAVERGERFQGIVPLGFAKSPLVFTVFLNCYKHGLPYDRLKAAAALCH